MKQHITKTYSFDELSEESKEKAIDEFRDTNDNFEIYCHYHQVVFVI